MDINKKRATTVFFGAALVLALVPAVSAAPLDEARKAFASGKYAQVDDTLGTLLEKRPVDDAVLELSFQAAIKAGRFYTAERRYGELTSRGAKVKPELVFEAALVADAIGKANLRRDRLLYFLKSETGWNENVERALILLCRTDPDGDHFARLMAAEQPTETLFEFGIGVLADVMDNGRFGEVPKMADAILGKFHDKAHASRVLNRVAGVPAQARRDMLSAVVRHPVAGTGAFRTLAMMGEFGAGHVIDYVHFNKELPPEDIFAKIADLKGTVPADARASYAQKALAFRNLVLERAKKPAEGAAQQTAYNPDYLMHYLSMIASCPELFFADGAPLDLPSQEMATMFSTVATAKYNDPDIEPLRKLASNCYYAKAWAPEHARVIVATYPRLFDTRALFFDSKIMEQVRQTKNTAKIAEILGKNPDRPDLWRECLSVFFDSGDAAMLKKTTEMQVMAYPVSFDGDNLARYFLSSPSMGVDERVNFLRGLFARTGYSEPWRKLVSFGALPIDVKENAGFKAFAESVKPDAQAGSDPLAGAVTALARIPQPGGNQALDPKAFEIAKKAMATYGKQFPDPKDPIRSRQAQAVWDVMRQRCQIPEDKSRAVSIFIRSFGKGAPFQDLLKFAGDSRNPTNYMAVAGAALKADAFRPEYFQDLTYPKGFAGSILEPYYKDMTPASAIGHVIKNWNGSSWALAKRFEQVNALFKAHSPVEYPYGQLDNLLSMIQDELSATNRCAGMLDLEPLAKDFIDEHRASSWQRAKVALLYALEGRSGEILPRYFTASSKAEPAVRFADFLRISSCNYGRRYLGEGGIPLIAMEKEGEVPTQFQMGALLRDFVLPALKAIPLRQAGMMQKWSWTAYFTDRLRDEESRTSNKRDNAMPAETLDALATEFAIRAHSGMPVNRDDRPREYLLLRRAFASSIEKGNGEAAARMAWGLGRSFWQNWDDGSTLAGILKNAMDKGFWEPAHIVASAVNTDNAQIMGRFQRIRSDCSLHMPGIYPVDESSPLYPLYVAADELERNNSERSWALLNTKQNLETFEREAAKLPASFVAWSVEQLRLARGKDDQLLVKARKIASELLKNEKALAPELAASLMLTRAECYRDQRNFEAARLEYQSIRNGDFYKGTKAARKAMFRDVDLLIEMGNVAQAEQIVELWLSQPDAEIQAQAHYFTARIAFDRKDFEEARKQLDEVFSIDYTHTEARLLHGQWKLATNSEVDDTNVWVGDLSDRTIIRPGQELTVSVQDRNLGIAGGGNSIPVVITTSAGGDKEQLNLYPSVRNPALFNGSISTMLGAASPGNHILEVCGGDEVSYEIDPEFMAARGLKAGEPKVLRIVDDARLAIGAAAPRAEEGHAEKALEQIILSAGGGNKSSDLTSNLKPGNPIYVVVRDRDRSLTTGIDSVTVDARTSSGDKLEGIELVETDGTSGIFRGEIPTQLPPPRAFASDSAVGVNPGDVINSRRNDPAKNVWRSAPDGTQGKWLEVDTMGSYMVSNVAVMIPNFKDVTSLRLTGRLADETFVLGTIPQGDISKRYGMHYQVAQGNRLNSAQLIRSRFSASGAVAAKTVDRLAFTPIPGRDVDQNAMLGVPFVLPQQESGLRFRLEAADTTGRTLEGLWMAICIDGAQVFSGQGNMLHMQSFPVEVQPGPHLLEVFFSAQRRDDAINVRLEDAEGKAIDFPKEWTDPKVYPALEEFVKDVAQIHRIEGGFQATLSRPVRLRSLRWEFLGYNGRDVTVSKLYVQDDKGRMVIPAESDYSDALQNEFLEVAPGDSIVVTYGDDRTSSGERRILERSMDSSFHDAQLNFFFEEIRQTGHGNEACLYSAYRFVPGDMMIIGVVDPDGDVTPEADKVVVKIETRSGISANMTLVEQNRRYANRGWGGGDSDGIHGGVFLGQLRTCDATSTNVPRGVLPISAGDIVTMTYHDRENTNPGVPTERSVSVRAAQQSNPRLILFDTVQKQVEDTSYDAKLKLAQIRRRPGNDSISKLYKDIVVATAIPDERIKEGEDVPANVATSIPIALIDPSRARHEASVIQIDAVAESELEEADAMGRDPDIGTYVLKLGKGFKDMRSNLPQPKDPGEMGLFCGLIDLSLGPPDPGAELPENATPALPVNGNDRVRVRIYGPDGSVQDEIWFKLVSGARLSLMDSTYSAERNMAHVGERFFIMVRDADQDDGEDLNTVEVNVSARGSKVARKAILRETLPHSGIFTGTIRPVIFAPGDDIPAVATGGVAVAEEDYLDDRIAVRYGDKITFAYNDAETLPSLEAGPISVAGDVFKGSDGNVRLFSKRFRDSDMAVLVQFRLAECLFESAKEFRRLKQPERSAEAIDEGKHILEEALRNYPTTIHLVQGEYLLANLYQELANEEKDSGNKEEAEKLYSEALSRFSAILSTWPDSEFAPKAQYHKALCLEMLGNYNSSSEEYVKMTYLYPESPLVGDAAIRLATYYYKNNQFDTAGRIYANFQKRFPTHEKADRALFMGAQCHMKQAQFLSEKAKEEGKAAPALLMKEEYKLAVEALSTLVEQYRETAAVSLRSQALYWAGDASLRAGDYQSAFLFLKRTTFEYPETEWARRARGLLLQEAKAFEDLE